MSVPLSHNRDAEFVSVYLFMEHDSLRTKELLACVSKGRYWIPRFNSKLRYFCKRPPQFIEIAQRAH